MAMTRILLAVLENYDINIDALILLAFIVIIWHSTLNPHHAQTHNLIQSCADPHFNTMTTLTTLILSLLLLLLLLLCETSTLSIIYIDTYIHTHTYILKPITELLPFPRLL